MALRCSEEPPVALRAGALVQAAWLANDQSDFDAAAELAEQSLELFRSLHDARGIAQSLYHLAIVAGHRSEYNRAQALAEESLRLFRDAGDREGVAAALEYIGIFTLNQGDYSRARQLLEQSLRLWRELADPWGTAWSLTVSGLAAGRLREYKEAESYLTEALPLWQELGDQRGRAGCNEFLAEVRQGTGDLASASACYLEALALFQRAGNKWSIAQCLQKLGTVACAQRKWELAAHYFGAGLALHEAIQAPVNPADSAHFNREIERTRAALGARRFAVAWQAGQAMTIEEAVAFATAQTETTLARPPRTPLQAAKASFGGLTARERQVAALVAQGRSNREIAQVLVVTERTVAVHISNILAKLSLTSRTQIATWAVARGLGKS